MEIPAMKHRERDQNQLRLPDDLRSLLEAAPSVTWPASDRELVDAACGGPDSNYFEVAYDVPGRGRIVEATVARVRNGVAANYLEPYMRRRDPDCMFIADDAPSDKVRFHERFKTDFDELRAATFDWLRKQDLVAFAFIAGSDRLGYDAIVVAPANAGFFALGLALLQGIRAPQDLPADFKPQAVIYVAPTFRHTHFNGKQVVVHNRTNGLHELF